MAGVLVAGCGGGKGPAGAARTSSTTSTLSTDNGTATTAATSSPAGGRQTTPTTAKGSGSTATTVKGAGADPPPVRPPAPGSYSYATTGKYTYGGRDHALPAHTPLVVDPANGTSQQAVRTLRDVDDNGPVVRSTLRYEPDGLYLDSLRQTTRVEGLDDSREYRPSPPLLLAPRGADVGYRASFDAADGGTTIHVDSTIERRGTVMVDGSAVECYVVRAVTTFHGTFEGSGEGTSCVSLAHRLLLSEDVSFQFTVGPTHVEGAYRAVLERLTPSPAS
jgi:hypothetical protein